MSTEPFNDEEFDSNSRSRTNWPSIRIYVAIVATGAILSLLFYPSVRLIESFIQFAIGIATVFGLLSIIATLYAFTFTLPWLWFRNPWIRVTLAFMVPMMQWSLLLLGCILALQAGVKDVAQSYPFFATSLLFGSLPSVTLRWWRQWQIAPIGGEQDDCRMTITDLFGLSLAAALILALLRIANQTNQNSGILSLGWVFIAFSAMIGLMATIPTLTAIRIFLRPMIRMTNTDRLGIGLTCLLVIGTFAITLYSGNVYPGNPIAGCFASAIVSLGCVLGTASGIALLLRRSGLRLSTRSNGQRTDILF